MFGAAIGGEILLEFFDVMAEDEGLIIENFVDGAADFFAERGVLRGEV